MWALAASKCEGYWCWVEFLWTTLHNSNPVAVLTCPSSCQPWFGKILNCFCIGIHCALLGVPRCDRCTIACRVAQRSCMLAWCSWILASFCGITSFVGCITTLILGVSYKDIMALILEVSYDDDYSWGTPCWLVALMCVVARCVLCLTSSCSSGSAVVS